MFKPEISERIRQIVESHLGLQGLELIDLVFHWEKGRPFLRLLVDKPGGGITIDECAHINEEIGRILDKDDLIPEGYVLEVSSPGIDRPLTSQKDFRRVIGKRIKFLLSKSIDGKNELIAKLIEVKDKFLIVDLESKNFQLPIEIIIKAKQII